MPKKTTKKRNATDLTLRNLHAANRRIAALEVHIRNLISNQELIYAVLTQLQAQQKKTK